MCVVVLAPLVGVAPAWAWTWPTSGTVVQPFLFDPDHPYGAGQHRGVDIGGDAGEQVRAPAAGVVSFVGSVPGSGRSVTIETGDGWSVTLTHLGTTVVTKGATVAEGDGVGTIGPSGDPEVSGPYVHLGVRHTDDDQGYVDPLSLLPASVPAPPAPPAIVDPGASAPPVATAAAPAPVVAAPDVSAPPGAPESGASGPSAATLVAPDPQSATPASAAAPIVLTTPTTVPGPTATTATPPSVEESVPAASAQCVPSRSTTPPRPSAPSRSALRRSHRPPSRTFAIAAASALGRSPSRKAHRPWPGRGRAFATT